jgi:hypothetical protein
MAEVIQIGDLALRRKDRGYGFTKPGECKHFKLTLDDNGDLVQCDDCKVYVSAYWALKLLTLQFERGQSALKAGWAQLAERTKERATLLATRKVDEAWRSRSMVPACPHCHEAIFPEDGLGSHTVNKEIAQKRRADQRHRKGTI